MCMMLESATASLWAYLYVNIWSGGCNIEGGQCPLHQRQYWAQVQLQPDGLYVGQHGGWDWPRPAFMAITSARLPLAEAVFRLSWPYCAHVHLMYFGRSCETSRKLTLPLSFKVVVRWDHYLSAKSPLMSTQRKSVASFTRLRNSLQVTLKFFLAFPDRALAIFSQTLGGRSSKDEDILHGASV